MVSYCNSFFTKRLLLAKAVPKTELYVQDRQFTRPPLNVNIDKSSNLAYNDANHINLFLTMLCNDNTGYGWRAMRWSHNMQIG